MNIRRCRIVLLAALIFLISTAADSQSDESIRHRINPPPGYRRIEVEAGDFGDWLRNLPLKTGNPPVHLFNGELKRNQTAHFAVVDMDIGNKDLQQCADAIIRLRAEYLYSIADFDAIHFNFSSGDRADFRKWINGFRPVVEGEKVSWVKSGIVDSSHSALQKYLETVMIYAGSYSLQKELKHISVIAEMQIGDIFIQGGFPGHAEIVVEMAENPVIGEKLFLLAQSFMPAQEIHILKSPFDSSPWYPLDFGDLLDTPEWTFRRADLYRFNR